jgi:hypothetical protein
MLKAVVVYVPGSGGNLITRSLALADHTVAYVPESLAKQQPTLTLTSSEKFKLCNNWNPSNWPATETDIGIWYHWGCQDFVNYEQSDLLLIDQFHPVAFEDENNKKTLWETPSVWEQTILITWKTESFNYINKLAIKKRKDLNHSLPRELNAFKRLSDQHTGLTIAWEHMQDEQCYITEIDRLAGALHLQLDLDLVRQLWQSWRYATDTLLNNE